MLIAFIDDEQRVLDGIRRMVFAAGLDWDVVCSTDPGEILDLVSEKPVDVVVSDMRMPVMDGARLLREVHTRRPETIRIVLTGQADEDIMLRAMPVAHRFLNKPCRAEQLCNTIDRVVAFRSAVANDELQRLVGATDQLPTAPKVYIDLTRALEDENTDLAIVAGIVGKDPALAAKVLHICHSAYYAGEPAFTDIRSAVTRIGLDLLRRLVLGAEVFGVACAQPAALQALQARSMLASRIATRVANEPRLGDQVATAALLADVGQLLPLIDVRGDGEIAARLVQMHAEAGAYLLGLWGLPAAVAEAVAYHHHPSRSDPERFGLAGMTHVAVALAGGAELDLEYLERAGVAHQLETWREEARELGAPA